MHLYEFGNDDLSAGIITYGAAVQKLLSFGRDVTGGYDELEAYIGHDSYQGAIVGRYANRIRNAQFSIGNKTYFLEKNCESRHTLHSGSTGFSHLLWNAAVIDDNTLSLTLHSSDGEGGFPGNMDVSVTYSIRGCDLIIDYNATTDADTPFNITNHTYFNLNGLGGSILDHTVKLQAGYISEIDDDLVPTGKLTDVRGTIFDFTAPHSIGERIYGDFLGYDHNFVSFNGLLPSSDVREIATAENADRRLTIITDRPCIQFYIGNFLGSGPNFKNNIKQVKHGAFCFETQYAPYSIVSGEGILHAGDTFRSKTIYRIEKNKETGDEWSAPCQVDRRNNKRILS